MRLKKPELEKEIISTLSTMVFNINGENSVGFFDSNRAVQEFFTQFFSIIYGYDKLVDLDIVHDTASFPAVDIGDEVNGIAFQVTSTTTKAKVSHTLEVFLKKNMHLTYPKLVICMLGEVDDFKDDFDLGGIIEFNKADNIWDIPYLRKEIPKCSLDQLIELDEYFDKYLRSTSANRLIDADIRDAVDILTKNIYSVIDKLEADYSQLRIPNRSTKFIEAKNQLNGLDWDSFKVIQGHLMHNEKITHFLSSPINEDITAEYLALTVTLQDYYAKNRHQYEDIDNFMRYVFSILDTYDSELDSNKIKIIIHTMYFNCDIGDNPS